MNETFTTTLDERFRAAAAATGLLDVAYDVLPDTPIGTLLLGVTDHGVCRITFDPEPERELETLARQYGPRVLRSSRPVDELRRELDEYFKGRRREFELPIDWSLTRGFGRRVLRATAARSFGGSPSVSGASSSKAGRSSSLTSSGRSPRGRRRRTSSSTIRLAIVSTHARRWSPCSSRGYARSARRNVSWNASSAWSRPSRRPRKRYTSSLCAS